jgi:hypothetical protein
MGGGISAIPGEGLGWELGQLVYNDITLISWPGRIHSSVGLPDKFKLRLGYESLDFLDESFTPLVQFPYQVIISWGHSATSFRFSLPTNAAGIRGAGEPPIALHRENSILTLTLGTPLGVGPIIDQCIMKTVLKLMDEMKRTTTVTKEEFNMLKRSILVESPQTTAQVWDASGLCMTPAGTVEHAPESPSSASKSGSGSGGAKFPPAGFDMTKAELKEDFMTIIEQFSASRQFIAKQAMELVKFVGPLAPFERLDLAEMLYDRILNKESYQLVINALDTKEERENLGLRFKKKGFVFDTHLVDC